jgi:hypothetical protein
MKCVGIKTMMDSENWNELLALKEVISYNPASVSPDKMELFTKLLIESFEYRGQAFLEFDEQVS